jgi:hypothetical protein
MKLFQVSPSKLSNLLCVLGGAERAGDERLRLTSREDRRSVRARQDTGFDPDRAHLVERAPSSARRVQHFVAQDLFFQALEDLLGLDLPFDFALRKVATSSSST